ncbi:hypothetical protein TMatcc_001211 [Talaromyces marneffei ATCC 18224]|uniref:BYS1 domain protein n=1 Tax=Talaromyces marneffei (strain ATCC 18224 / CBS 334.59 / QM 7333) TaxID=441960 RepID=B6QWL7_TALMQ|nr:conserved hypothetical protein [Talaromyces marneffei ATCC 18224]
MYTLFTILTVIGAFSFSVLSGHIAIINACQYDIYVWTQDIVGLKLAPHTQYSEGIYESYGGVDIKLSTAPEAVSTCSAQMFFTYNLVIERGQVWYALNNIYGSPFHGEQVTVVPVNPTGELCTRIKWRAGVSPRGLTRVYWCGRPTSLHLYACIDPGNHSPSDDHNEQIV